MLLSVIIVNYRVPFFLELCLRSVQNALKDLDAEIIVVDNHSGDGAIDWLQPRFTDVKWILNAENLGFSRANNQALATAAGKYILFLNPDTILPEDFAKLCLGFLGSTPNTGGLGVRMIDGSGKFLKESRRGIPTPWVAFCRLAGLSALFPHSRRFSQYYLGYLPPDKTDRVPVLSGACLWVSRAALEKAGSFDESFFMYAEDIDLCYRLGEAGYTNYYFADTTIIHFKGESTQKDTRYVRRFYKAMSQFRRKHFNTGPRKFLGLLLDSAIWIRGGLSAVAAPLGRLARGSHNEGGSFSKGGPRRSFLTGDPAAIRQLQPRVTAAAGGATEGGVTEGGVTEGGVTAARVTEAGETEANEIIFCIGAAFSFKAAITALKNLGPGKTAAFYVTGGNAVISSTSSDTNGDIRVVTTSAY